MFLFNFYSLISPARLYSADRDGCYAFWMYCIEEQALRLGNGSLPDYIAETFWVTGCSPSPPAVKELDETGTTAGFGLLPVQSRVKNNAIVPRFQYQHVL